MALFSESEYLPSNLTLRTLVLRRYSGAIIGDNGSIQKQVEKACNTKMFLSRYMDGPSAPLDRVLSICGAPHGLGRTCARVVDLISQRYHISQRRQFVFDVIVPEGIAERLIRVDVGADGSFLPSNFEAFQAQLTASADPKRASPTRIHRRPAPRLAGCYRSNRSNRSL